MPPHAWAQLLVEGSRIQECFRLTEDDTNGSWFGGVVGPTMGGRTAIAFDDGDLVWHSREDLLGLSNMGKFKACIHPEGLLADAPQSKWAKDISLMQCGKVGVPVGVLMVSSHDISSPGVGGLLYHSHILHGASLDEALQSCTRRQPPRGRNQRSAATTPGNSGLATFRRGDIVGYIGGNDDDYCEEIILGVQFIHDGKQHRRYVYTYDSAMDAFSVGSFTTWVRVQAGKGASFDPEDSRAVKCATDEAVTTMLAAWEQSPLKNLNTLAKLRHQASLGPAQV